MKLVIWITYERLYFMVIILFGPVTFRFDFLTMFWFKMGEKNGVGWNET